MYPSVILYPFLLLALPQDDVDVTGQQATHAGVTVVTARKMEEILEDVPGSVSIVSGDDIEAAGARSLADVAGRVPNLRLTEFTARRLSFPYIRGIGSGQGEPAVVTYVDGVPQLAVGSTNLPLVGLERVEFLRGPQGTLYGRNALGGVIHYISARPGPELAGDAEVTFGDYSLQEYRASVGGPIGGGDTRYSFDALYSMRDGYTKNDATGDDVDDRDAFYGRGQVLMKPSADSELRVGLYGERARDGAFALTDLEELRDRPHRLDQDFEGSTERDVVAPSVTYVHTGQELELTSVTAYTDWSISEESDFDFTNVDALRRFTDEEQQYFYQEVRVASTEEEGLRWLAGFSGFLSAGDQEQQNETRPGGFPPPFVGTDTNTGDFDDYGLGVFGQVVVPVGERWEVTGGLRYDREDKQADLNRTTILGGFTVNDVDRDLDETYDEVVPTVSAGYRATDATTVYGTVSRGWKAGGFNLSAPDDDAFQFDTEESWTYEVGVKHTFEGERVRLRAAVFQIDWEDMQLSQFDATTQTGFVDNVGESQSRGVELEVDADLTSDLVGFASFGYVDTELEDFTGVFGDVDDGNELPFAPDHTWSLGLEYRHDLREGLQVFAGAEYVGVGSFYYDVDNVEDESFDLTHLRAGVRAGDWTFSGWVRNVFDEEYVPIAFQNNPADRDDFVGESGAPRTYGFSLRFSF
jgi:iron complex outermembrane receptor protein